MWMLVHRVHYAELLERNTKVNAFLCCKLQKGYGGIINSNKQPQAVELPSYR
ncbi:hypothetical protein ACP70R_037699 [Stipagrostis hirtigluma subsp. patula]